jgi:hypothetical protein
MTEQDTQLPNITITVDDEFINRLAKALNGRLGNEAQQTVRDAGMAAPPPEAPPDPWADSPPAPPQQPPAAAPQQARTITVNTSKGSQTWTLGAGNAPPCNCGNPAAYVQGATNGRGWKRWACALGADSDAWRNKCDFSLWA